MQLRPRKRLFVDPQIQGTLLYRIGIYWCFSVLAVCLVTLCFWALVYPTPAESFLDYFPFYEFFVRYGTVLLASLVLVPIIMLDVLLLSNRFSGPLFRLRSSLRDLAAGGPVQHVRFRKKDFLQDLADDFNAVVDRVERLERELEEAKRDAQSQDFHPAVGS